MGRQSDGFSLIELLIAMVVTLLVTGAMFGLLTAGQSAFRREPQLTERQQSLRQAMTIVQEDVVRAGAGLPGFAQVFTDGLNATGLPGTLGIGATDTLEILTSDPSCPPAMACDTTLAGQAGNIQVTVPPATCAQPSLPSLFAFFDGGGVNIAIQPVTAVTGVVGNCASELTADARVPGTLGGGTFSATGYVPVQLVRYEIANCLAPDNDVPCLYRSVTGTADASGAAVGPAPGPPGNLAWQVVARGIEDLQVQYRVGANPGGAVAWPWNDTAGGVVAANYGTLVTQIQVTLVARALASRLQGETNNAVGPRRVRGQLTGIFTPRTVLAVLSQAPVAAGAAPLWQ